MPEFEIGFTIPEKKSNLCVEAPTWEEAIRRLVEDDVDRSEESYRGPITQDMIDWVGKFPTTITSPLLFEREPKA